MFGSAILNIMEFCDEIDFTNLYYALPRYREIMKKGRIFFIPSKPIPFRSEIYDYPNAPSDCQYLRIPKSIENADYGRFNNLLHVAVYNIKLIPGNTPRLTIFNLERSSHYFNGYSDPKRIYPNINTLEIIHDTPNTIMMYDSLVYIRQIIKIFPNIERLVVFGTIAGLPDVSHRFNSVLCSRIRTKINSKNIIILNNDVYPKNVALCGTLTLPAPNGKTYAPHVRYEDFYTPKKIKVCFNDNDYIKLLPKLRYIEKRIEKNIFFIGEIHNYSQIIIFNCESLSLLRAPKILVMCNNADGLNDRYYNSAICGDWSRCDVYIGKLREEICTIFKKNMFLLSIIIKDTSFFKFPKYISYLDIMSNYSIISKNVNCNIYIGRRVGDTNINAKRKILINSTSRKSPISLILSGNSHCAFNNVECLGLTSYATNLETLQNDINGMPNLRVLWLHSITLSEPLILPPLEKLCIMNVNGIIQCPNVGILYTDLPHLQCVQCPNIGKLVYPRDIDILGLLEITFDETYNKWKLRQ